MESIDVTNYPKFNNNFNMPYTGYESNIPSNNFPTFDNFYATYLYNHLTYYWNLLHSYRNRIDYLQNIIDNFRETQCNISTHINSKNCADTFVKTVDNLPSNNALNKIDIGEATEIDIKKPLSGTSVNEIIRGATENPLLKSENDNIDLYYSTVEDCDVEVTSLPPLYDDNLKTENKNKDIRDTVARLRLIGLSFLDMGHLLLHDDPRHPIIPKSNTKNVEYRYPPADES